MSAGYPSSGNVPVGKPSRGNILIADDEPMLLRGLDRVLTRAGFEVVTVSDGLKAAEMLMEIDFDAIVSDISMPGMSGIQLLRAARERDLDVPVLLVTGAPAVETAVEALEYGAFQYLTKPVDSKQFEQAIEKAVQLHRMALMKREALALLGTSQAMAGDRAGLEASFERTLQTLWMAYQPIVRAQDRDLFGYEALLRSGEPTLPHPGAILDAAERLDRLQLLGRTIRDSAARPIEPRPEWGSSSSTCIPAISSIRPSRHPILPLENRQSGGARDHRARVARRNQRHPFARGAASRDGLSNRHRRPWAPATRGSPASRCSSPRSSSST